jgi:hypothetical protein
MRPPVLAVALSFAAFAPAQVALPPHLAIYNGYTRGFQLTAALPFTIVQLELPLDARQPGDTASFLVRRNGAIALRSVGTAGPTLATSLAIAAGDVVDVLGNWSPAVTSSTSAHNSYGSGAPWTTVIEGVPHVLQRSGWQWDVGDAGFANGIPLLPGAGLIGRVLVHTAPAGTPATNTPLGVSCGPVVNNSAYQHFADAAAAAAALADGVLVLTPAGNGYVASWIGGAAGGMFVPPDPDLVALPTGDDGDVAYTIVSGPLATPYGPRSTLRIGGNGVIAFGPAPIDTPGTSAWLPTPSGLLDAVQGGVSAWHDFNATEPGSGPIVAHEAGGTLYVTFDRVESWSSPASANPSTVQFQLELATGEVRVLFVAVDAATSSPFGSGWLVGVSAPGPSHDPGSVALAAGPWVCADPETRAPVLSAVSRPVGGTSWRLAVRDVPATAVFGVDVFGWSDPGLDLGVLGMPGCALRASADVMHAFVPLSDRHAYTLAVPAASPLLGLDVFTTSALWLWPPPNAFGAITTNGVAGRIGDV